MSTVRVWTCNESDPTVWTSVEIRVPSTLDSAVIVPMRTVAAGLAEALYDVDPDSDIVLPYKETVRWMTPTEDYQRIAWFKPERGERYVIAVCDAVPAFNPFEVES